METEKTQNSEDFSSKQFGRVTPGTTTLDDVEKKKAVIKIINYSVTTKHHMLPREL